jgi:hypothetical protein
MSISYYIIGSGGFAKEVFFYTQKTLGSEYKFGGFIDNNIALKSGLLIEESLFLETIQPNDEVVLFNGIGNPELINKIHLKFKEYNFPNLIYPGVLADFSNLKIGFGNIITPNCILTSTGCIASNRTTRGDSTKKLLESYLILHNIHLFSPSFFQHTS